MRGEWPTGRWGETAARERAGNIRSADKESILDVFRARDKHEATHLDERAGVVGGHGQQERASVSAFRE